MVSVLNLGIALDFISGGTMTSLPSILDNRLNFPLLLVQLAGLTLAPPLSALPSAAQQAGGVAPSASQVHLVRSVVGAKGEQLNGQSTACIQLYDVDNQLVASGKPEKVSVKRGEIAERLWQLPLINLPAGILPCGYGTG